jgi:hypothetical protein
MAATSVDAVVPARDCGPCAHDASARIPETETERESTERENAHAQQINSKC